MKKGRASIFILFMRVPNSRTMKKGRPTTEVVGLSADEVTDIQKEKQLPAIYRRPPMT